MKTIKVSYGGFETEQSVDECLYDAIYNKAINDFVNACKNHILCQTFGLHQCNIEEIAEQLKEEKHNG